MQADLPVYLLHQYLDLHLKCKGTFCFYKTTSHSPVVFGQSRASNSYRTSFSTLIDRAWILNICVRPCNTDYFLMV